MIVLIVFTAGYHAILNNSFGPLIVALPLSLKGRQGSGVSVEEKREDVDEVEEDEGEMQAKLLDQKARDKHADADRDVSPVEAEAGLVTEERRHGHHKNRHGGSVATASSHGHSKVSPTAISEGDRSANNSATDKDIANHKEDQEKTELERYGFAHPAASRPQQTVWIPHFTPKVDAKKAAKRSEEEARFVEELRGMSEKQIRACREAGVDARSDGAEMDGKGKVNVSEAPPGYSGL